VVSFVLSPIAIAWEAGCPSEPIWTLQRYRLSYPGSKLRRPVFDGKHCMRVRHSGLVQSPLADSCSGEVGICVTPRGCASVGQGLQCRLRNARIELGNTGSGAGDASASQIRACAVWLAPSLGITKHGGWVASSDTKCVKDFVKYWSVYCEAEWYTHAPTHIPNDARFTNIMRSTYTASVV
jgi:hypothetical protein